jgi:hypothetical protein
MTGEMGCDQVREVAPELALGIAEAQDRDAALRHLTSCAGCRRLVSELTSVGDELLLLAPAREPPPGLASRVLATVTEPPPRQRRWRIQARRWQFATAAASVVLAAALGGGSVFVATADERRLADGYQAVLSQGQGSFFAAAPLQGPQGRAGTVFGYQGHPSWVMATLRPPTGAEGRYQVQVVTRDGRYLPFGEVVLGGANGAWGTQLPVDLSAVYRLRFTEPDGRRTFTATFDTADPWH